ncbi:MAG: AMP-binding protein [Trueperaceae bacterium]|nr:AMP-binding protein [Trueperaceae bacterium]
MLIDLAQRRADLTPHRQALAWQGHWYDYTELNARAERLAAALERRGVREGDRVAILAHNDIAHFDLVLATAKLGFIYAPLNVRLAPTELAAYTAMLRPALLLVDEAHVTKAADIATPQLRLTEYDDFIAPPAHPLHRPELTPESIQMILPTGGTTGLPKGAMLPYRQGVFNAANTVLGWGLSFEDCVIQATPSFHAAINAFTVPLWHAGARVVLQRTFDPGEYLDLVERHRPTVLFFVPTMFQMLIEHPRFPEADLSCVRWAIYGGASCPDRVVQALAERGIALRQGYGLTEAGVNCFSLTDEQATQRPWSVGKPMLHAEAVVRRPDGSPCAAGELGELTLRGPHVFAGYFEKPEATAEVLKDGWLWTGDLATVDDDGFFAIKARRKEMFISGGENVFPAEVEAAVASHPAVNECAVVGVPDERWGEVGLATVSLKPDADLSEQELKAFITAKLARYKVPKHFSFVAALPKSGAGKILKFDIRQEFEARHVQEEEA